MVIYECPMVLGHPIMHVVAGREKGEGEKGKREEREGERRREKEGKGKLP